MLRGNSWGCLESATLSPWTEHKTPWLFIIPVCTIPEYGCTLDGQDGQECISFHKLPCLSSCRFPGCAVPCAQSQEGRTICMLLSEPVELQAKCLEGSPGAALLHGLPKWPINYLFTCLEYLQLQQKKACMKLMTLNYFVYPNCIILLIISTFWIQIVLVKSCLSVGTWEKTFWQKFVSRILAKRVIRAQFEKLKLGLRGGFSSFFNQGKLCSRTCKYKTKLGKSQE